MFEKEEEELFGYLERDEGVGILMFVIMGGWGIVKVSLLVMVLLTEVNPVGNRHEIKFHNLAKP